jgi:hypothetical protein
MTQPADTEVPELNYPRIVLMATDGIDGNVAPISWSVGEAHPFAPTFMVVAMFINEDFVEIYSVNNAKSAGMREQVPVRRARLIREAMPFDVFSEELADAENGYPEDDEPEPDPDLDPDGITEPAPANGQIAPS